MPNLLKFDSPRLLPHALSRPAASGGFACAMTQYNTNTILSPQQEEVLRQILPIARIATNGTVANLPIRPRTHKLIAGPSGGGKSHVARELGRLLSLPTLVVNVSSWVVLSARNEPWTFSQICTWLDASCSNGGILVLDECDKLSDGGSSWISHIVLEIHDLLDGTIPLSARLPDPPETEAWECTRCTDHQMRAMLSARLQEKVFVLGCGAWQQAWAGMAQRRIGFGGDIPHTEMPGGQRILDMMKPELRQRFCDTICWLPPMTSEDYLTVSSRIEAGLPEQCMREAWHRLAPSMIRRAVEGGLGMRVYEELMLSVLLESPGHPAHFPSKIPSYSPLI